MKHERELRRYLHADEDLLPTDLFGAVFVALSNSLENVRLEHKHPGTIIVSPVRVTMKYTTPDDDRTILHFYGEGGHDRLYTWTIYEDFPIQEDLVSHAVQQIMWHHHVLDFRNCGSS